MSFVEAIVFLVCLVAGPFIVARCFPRRVGVTGTPAHGQSGMAPLFWGIPAGMFLAAAILMPFAPSTVFSSMADRLQQTGLMFAILLVLSLPLLIWGSNRWTWNAEGIEFRGVFCRKKLAWLEIVKVELDREGGYAILTSQGVAMRTTKWVSGNQAILAALHHYRPSAFGVAATLGD